jgi:hypothetical protein
VALGAALELLTPVGAIVCLAALVPLAAAALGASRVCRARAVLRLTPPPREADATSRVALAAVVVLLGLAAAQPVLARESSQEVRTDAQVLIVLDVSRSMAAAAGLDAPTRLDRARVAGRTLRASIPEVETGVATLTDRVLPDLLPVADLASFEGTLDRSVGIEEPPPRSTAVRATTFAALEDVASGNYFTARAERRAVVLLTDGESQPYDESRVARALENRHITVETVRIWKQGESVFDADGKVDAAYRADPTGALALARLARATGGQAFEEDDVEAAASALQGMLGDGPTKRTAQRRPDDLVLSPFVAALALVPLAVLAYRRGARPTARLSGSYHHST